MVQGDAQGMFWVSGLRDQTSPAGREGRQAGSRGVGVTLVGRTCVGVSLGEQEHWTQQHPYPKSYPTGQWTGKLPFSGWHCTCHKP